MSRTEALIDEISHLPVEQMQQVYQALARHLQRHDKTEQLLARVCGTAAGLWTTDAQEYVTASHSDDCLGTHSKSVVHSQG